MMRTLAALFLVSAIACGCRSIPMNTTEAGPGIEAQTVFTCSMHPQIRLLKKGNCPVCGMALIADAPNK